MRMYLPRLSEVSRSFDEHRRRSESLELQYEMREVEFGLEVQLDVDAVDARRRLPPASL